MSTPQQIDTSAPVIARHQIFINAPVGVVWAIITDVAHWPQWQTGVSDIHVDRPLVPGRSFCWTSSGLAVESTLYVMNTPRRLVWGGPAQGIMGIHEWTFTPQDGGVLVRTQESWNGDPVRADVPKAQTILDGSITTWLDALKQTAEQATQHN